MVYKSFLKAFKELVLKFILIVQTNYSQLKLNSYRYQLSDVSSCLISLRLEFSL